MIKILNIIIFIIFLYVFFCTYSDKLFSISNVELMKSLGPVVSAIVAVFNLFFVLSINAYDRKRKIKTEKLDQKSFWFRKIIVEEHLEEINTLFNSLIESLDKEELTFENLITDFQMKKRKLIMVLNDQVRILNEDFADALDLRLDDFEDALTFEVEDYLTCPTVERKTKYSSLLNVITSNKKEYLKLLFEFEKDGYIFVAANERSQKIFKLIWEWGKKN